VLEVVRTMNMWESKNYHKRLSGVEESVVKNKIMGLANIGIRMNFKMEKVRFAIYTCIIIF